MPPFPQPVDADLVAPLVLPAAPGKPLTTQGGNTLDNGSGLLSAIGLHTLVPGTGTGNEALGIGALDSNTTGANNTAIGNAALAANTQGSRNVAVGQGALLLNTTGTDNVVVGEAAMAGAAVGASFNVAIGTSALNAVTGNSNVAVGYGAGNKLTSGNTNVAVGYGALNLSTVDVGTVAVGYNALNAGATGVGPNTAVGSSAMGSAAVTGIHNTAIGHTAGFSITSAIGCALVGDAAGVLVTSGGGNVALGYQALKAVTTGVNNTAVGNSAGITNPGAAINYTTCLGASTSATTAGGVAIGIDHTGTAAASAAQDSFVLGTSAHTVLIPGVASISTGPLALSFTTGSATNIAWPGSASIGFTVAGGIQFNVGGGANEITLKNLAIGLYGATPVAQPAAIAAPSGGTIVDTQARAAIASILNAIGAAAGGIGITA